MRLLAPYDALREKSREKLGLDYLRLYSRRFGSGRVALWFTDQREFRGTTTRQLSDSLGISFLLNDTDFDGRTGLRVLWREQRFLDERVSYLAGQIEMESVFSQNRYAGDDRFSFLASPLAGVGRGFFPEAGLGDATGKRHVSRLRDGRPGRVHLPGRARLLARLAAPRTEAYRFTGYYTAATRDGPSEAGFALSFDPSGRRDTTIEVVGGLRLALVS